MHPRQDTDQVPPSRQVLLQDGCDRWAYGQALQDLPELGALVGRAQARFAPAGRLAQDVHASLYKLRPTPDEEAKPDPTHAQLLEQAMGTREWEQLRATTRLSAVGSAFGSLRLMEGLEPLLPEQPEEPEDEQGQGGQDGQDGQGAPGLLAGCADQDAQRRALRRLLEEAREGTEQDMEAWASLAGGQGCGDGEGRGGQADLARVADLSRRLRRDPRLRRIAEMAGRMRRLAACKRPERVRRGPDEVVDVELGRDLPRLLPSERLALVMEETETEALLRYAEGRLLQWRCEGVERRQKGPVVVLVDESGSMAGDREVWAKGLALGLMSIARRDRRGFACGTFSIGCRLSDWGREPGMDQVLEFLSRESSGGTRFEPALGAAMAIIEQAAESGGEMAQADVVMVTDGAAGLGQEFVRDWRERAKRHGVHLYAIYIGVREQSLDAISDGNAWVGDLREDGSAIELAFGI